MTLASIVDTSIKTPRVFVKVSLGVGPRSAGAAPMRILMVGNKTMSGTATNNVKVAVTSEGDAATLFGRGSELHLACRAVLRANKFATLYALPISYTGSTVASSTITFVNAATSAGVVDVYVLGEKVSTPIASGAAIADIATAVAAAINAKTDWPVTASAALGVVTVSAKAGWVRAAQISLRASSTMATTTTTVSGTGYLGSTAGNYADDPSTGLVNVAAERFHIIAHGYGSSSDIGKFKTHVATYAAPIEGRRAVHIGVLTGTYSASKTIADAINDQRGILAWYENPDDTGAMIAGAMAGALTAQWGADRAYNTDGLLLTQIKVQGSSANVPTSTAINNALSNGMTALYGDPAGTDVKIVRAVTSYHLDGSSNPDFGVIDAHYVQVADFVADDLESNFATAFAGYKLGVDGDDGAPPGPRIATPSIAKDFIYRRLQRQDNVLLENVELLKDSIIVERDGSAAGRLNAEVPIDVIELLHQAAIDVRHVG